MTQMPSPSEFIAIRQGHDANPARSLSLRTEAYTDPRWFNADLSSIFAKTWQWVCHVEKVRETGCYIAVEIAGQPIVVVRGADNELRAFYNVCKHRAHQLLSGSGRASKIMCPYHAWTYRLEGQLARAPHTESLHDFNVKDICLDQVRVEVFCGFVFVNLDLAAAPLAEISGDLATEVKHWAPDIEQLTFGHRLTYDIKSNWKNVVDNFLECYHCPTAHKDFCTLVDMDTYKVTTHGIYSSHMADAGKSTNTAYDVSNATVRTHAVWWLWPTTCLMRYPGGPRPHFRDL
jgi:carnitine monooxygenase subunit